MLGQAEFAFCLHNNVNDQYELSCLVFPSESTSILYVVLWMLESPSGFLTKLTKKTFLVDQIH